MRCAIALTENSLLFKAQLNSCWGFLIEEPQAFTEVRIRSEGIFSNCFKVKAVSLFLPTFFIRKWYSFTSIMRSSNVAFYTTVVIGFANPITVVYGKHNLSTDFSFSSFFHFSSPTSQSLRRLDDRYKQKEWAYGNALHRDVNSCRSRVVAARRLHQATETLKPEQTESGVAKHLSDFFPRGQVTLYKHTPFCRQTPEESGMPAAP